MMKPFDGSWRPWGKRMFEICASKIFLSQAPTDMRRSIDGLSILVADHLGMHPQDGSLYVFCNRGRDKIKILYWSCNGFCLWYKRLEKDRFKISFCEGSAVLSGAQLRWLLDGLDYQKLSRHEAPIYQSFY